MSELADDLTAQLGNKPKGFQRFSIVTDEITDNTGIAQVAHYILHTICTIYTIYCTLHALGVWYEHLIVTEELAQIVALHITRHISSLLRMNANLNLPLKIWLAGWLG